MHTETRCIVTFDVDPGSWTDEAVVVNKAGHWHRHRSRVLRYSQTTSLGESYHPGVRCCISSVPAILQSTALEVEAAGAALARFWPCRHTSVLARFLMLIRVYLAREMQTTTESENDGR